MVAIIDVKDYSFEPQSLNQNAIKKIYRNLLGSVGEYTNKFN
jgi:hypothetical protein